MVEQKEIVGHLTTYTLAIAVLFRLLFNQSEFQAELTQQVKNFHFFIQQSGNFPRGNIGQIFFSNQTTLFSIGSNFCMGKLF